MHGVTLRAFQNPERQDQGKGAILGGFCRGESQDTPAGKRHHGHVAVAVQQVTRMTQQHPAALRGDRAVPIAGPDGHRAARNRHLRCRVAQIKGEGAGGQSVKQQAALAGITADTIQWLAVDQHLQRAIGPPGQDDAFMDQRNHSCCGCRPGFRHRRGFSERHDTPPGSPRWTGRPA